MGFRRVAPFSLCLRLFLLLPSLMSINRRRAPKPEVSRKKKLDGHAGELEYAKLIGGEIVPGVGKGAKDFRVFVASLTLLSDAQKKRLIARLESHQQLSKPFKAGDAPTVIQEKLCRLRALKSQIFELMKQADVIASEIKEKV